MIEAVQILWSPARIDLPSLGPRALVDVTDGDAPNVRMPIRMLSVDTPEVTARTPERASTIDQEFLQLAEWIDKGRAPISRPLAEFLLPQAADWACRQPAVRAGHRGVSVRKRKHPNPPGPAQRVHAQPVHPRRRPAVRRQRPSAGLHRTELLRGRASDDDPPGTGNLQPRPRRPRLGRILRQLFVHPGQLDLPLLVEAADTARAEPRGIWADPHTLLAYEYRAVEKLFQITRRIVGGETLAGGARFAWGERYSVDMRTRMHGPDDYFEVPPEYQLWLWPRDVGDAVGRLKLVPSPRLMAAT